MRKQFDRLRSLAPTIAFVALFGAFIGTVMVPGYRLARELSATTAALKIVSEQRSQPDVVARLLATLRDQLEAGQYIGRTIKDLDGTVASYDLAVRQLQREVPKQATAIATIAKSWAAHRARLAPIVDFKGVPYRDSDAGTSVTAAGRALLASTRETIKAGRDETAQLSESMSAISAALERDAVADAATLRHLMIVGVAFAAALVALLVYFQLLKARHERVAREARSQTRDILATVKEGLFLIDSQFRIGKTHSTALSSLLRREDFDGKSFDDLLFGLVSEKTLDTAMKYVKLLWGERANENLIKSINPLAEVEVNFGHGDVRYLEFDFHRVKGERGVVRQVLVSVSDVTSRVMLGRELKQSEANNAMQMDVLLGILKIDPEQMASFLADSEAELNQINAVLKVPVREEAKFRHKVDQLFREMHKLKGEAAALGVESVETRAHAFEDVLKELRERPELSGDDFLPLVVRLDDLFAHLKSLRDLMQQLEGLRAVTRPAAAPVVPPAMMRTTEFQAMVSPSAPLSGRPGLQIAAGLETFVQRIAADHGRKATLVAQGFDLVPPHYLRVVRGIAVQFVRNAVVHGIEDGPSRTTKGKPETGTIQVLCRPCGEGFEMLFQDDGAGLIASHLREVAVERGTLSADEAAALDERSTLALIFRAGFSTHEGDDKDAGRGVGLDLVSKWVQALGGQISVATAPGKFTRFRIVLPSETRAQGAVA